jgi:hypothetical protein
MPLCPSPSKPYPYSLQPTHVHIRLEICPSALWPYAWLLVCPIVAELSESAIVFLFLFGALGWEDKGRHIWATCGSSVGSGFGLDQYALHALIKAMHLCLAPHFTISSFVSTIVSVGTLIVVVPLFLFSTIVLVVVLRVCRI